MQIMVRGFLILRLVPKYVTRVQQQRPESPTVTLTWHACKSKPIDGLRCKYKVHKLHQRHMLLRYVYMRMYLWWSLCTLYLHVCQVTVTVGRLRSLLLYLCYIFRALINSFVCFRSLIGALVVCRSANKPMRDNSTRRGCANKEYHTNYSHSGCANSHSLKRFTPLGCIFRFQSLQSPDQDGRRSGGRCLAVL